ncbi:MAG TPA: acyl-CoA thioesterase, partial [Planctomycetaceae bacterium]|nr:acyl-CoA thioesterase [Planctomycetaceae bacterium]
MSVPFKTSRRVEFADTDMAGLIHFVTFYRMMESVEHEMFRTLGTSVMSEDENGNRRGWP